MDMGYGNRTLAQVRKGHSAPGNPKKGVSSLGTATAAFCPTRATEPAGRPYSERGHREHLSAWPVLSHVARPPPLLSLSPPPLSPVCVCAAAPGLRGHPSMPQRDRRLRLLRLPAALLH